MTGILGGTFDPVHLGHLKMAEAVKEQLDIRRILMIPDGDPPHKGKLAPAKDRLKMLRLAIEGKAGLEISDIEIRRAGVTYTVDTLCDLLRENPAAKYLYIVGADTLMVIETWRNFAKVARMLAGLAVVPRPGTDEAALEAQARMIEQKYRLPIHLIAQPVSALSSSQIRMRAARHQSLAGYVPESVERYIRSRRLYEDAMIARLRETMTPARYRHTLGVERAAVHLAKKYMVDPEKARLAALLHDGAKHMPMEEMLSLVKREGVPLAKGEDESRALLHAAAGMALARTEFGVDDQEILDAIRWHTTGRAGMTTLEKIVYLADMIEENRRVAPGLKEVREACERDLDEAMALAAKRTVDYVRSRQMPLNERTLELLKSMTKR